MGYLCLTGIDSAKARELVIRQGSATVPVLNENVVRAEKEATLLAKQTIVKELLPQFIAPRLLIQVQKLIEEKILNQPDRFIESVRMISSQETEALTEFTVLLEARMFQSRLISEIKRLNIALINDPVRHTILIYDLQTPPWEEAQKEDFLLALNRLLDPHKIRIRQTIPLPGDWLLLAATNPKQSLPKELLEESGVSTFLRTDFSRRHFRHNEEQEIISATLEIVLYEAMQGEVLGTLVVSEEFEEWHPAQAIEALLEKAALQWFPLITDLFAADQKKGTLLRVRMAGLPGPREEEFFVQNVFHSRNLWNQFQLRALSKNDVVYQGYYLGEPETLVPWFTALQHPSYGVKAATWQENELKIEVRWNEEIATLNKYEPIEIVEEWSKINDVVVTQRTLPVEGDKTTFALPLNSTVYDYLRSRGESTFFRVQWSQSGGVGTEMWYELSRPRKKKVVKGVWYQVGHTNLAPLVSIYDGQWNLIDQHIPSENGRIDFQYRLSSLQNHFYLRVSDLVGYIEGEAGSYLSLHYILNVSPLYPDDI